MKFLAIILLATLIQPSFGQQLKTNKYAGTYSYGSDAEKEPVGQIIIYPESDSTVLFYFESNSGPYSFSMGSIYERLAIKSDTVLFSSQHFPSCISRFEFSPGKLNIVADLDNIKCGFGHSVFLHGHFKKRSKKIPESFTDLEGKVYYFNQTTPEGYYQR